MNTLVIGGGGREHAITLALSKSPNIGKLIAAPGNPGIAEIAECHNINTADTDKVIELCKNNAVEFVVIGPEQPIVDGLSDKLNAHNIAVFAPSQFASQLESSKSFAKKFMSKYKIPTAKYAVFSKKEQEAALNYANEMETPIVIKADGLAAGKGVVIAENKNKADKIIKTFFRGKFGDASKKIVIEEFMQGEEVSIFAICDGKKFVVLPPAQDYKRISDGDTGKNTGGMGAYCPVSIVDKEMLQKIKKKIIKPTLAGMAKMGHPYVGCLYVGLMLDKGEPKVVEFNVRFGDPEAQAVLSVFQGDFLELLHSAATGKINKTAYNAVKTSKLGACCVIMASQGYPDKYETGKLIEGLDKALKFSDTYVFHSGTKLTEEGLVTAGGRVLGATGVCNYFATAANKAYQAVWKIKFDGMYYRKDIAKREEWRLYSVKNYENHEYHHNTRYK